MIKIIIQNNKLGDIVRVGAYEDGKWLKWIKKADIDKWVDIADEVENMEV